MRYVGNEITDDDLRSALEDAESLIEGQDL
jgi:hypothetical protein